MLSETVHSDKIILKSKLADYSLSGINLFSDQLKFHLMIITRRGVK